MTDYISRKAAKEAVLKAVGKGYSPFNAIVMLPAADVRPVVRARWIDTDNYYQRWKCSACGCHTRDAAPGFCPNCGADMREES